MRFPIPLMALLTALLALAGALSAASSTPVAAQETTTIPVGDTWFCNASFQGAVCETVVDAGDTIVWDFSGAKLPHTTTDCGASCDAPTGSPLWDSGLIADGSTFQFTFTEAGTYLYLCTVHPVLMRGRIVVQAPQPTPPTPTAEDFVPPGTVTPSATGVSGVPTTGQGPGDVSSRSWWPLAALGALGAALAGLGVATHRLGRQRRGSDG